MTLAGGSTAWSSDVDLPTILDLRKHAAWFDVAWPKDAFTQKQLTFLLDKKQLSPSHGFVETDASAPLSTSAPAEVKEPVNPVRKPWGFL